MNLRTMTPDDIIGMVAASKSRQVGEYVQPTLIGYEADGAFVPLSQRRTLRVTARTETPPRNPFFGTQVTYRGVDVFGQEFEFWPSDDPRPGFEHEWREESPL
jgi:hypothetical protein